MNDRKPHASNLRKGRYSQTGYFYFLTACVAGRRRVFSDRRYATIVLDTISWLHDVNRFVVDAAIVMPDHFHLVGQLGHCTLSKVMHTLKSFSANSLVRAGVRSPVWQKGYHDHGLRDDEDYRSRVRYVLENSVRAGLTVRAENYPYIILPIWWVEEAE